MKVVNTVVKLSIAISLLMSAGISFANDSVSPALTSSKAVKLQALMNPLPKQNTWIGGDASPSIQLTPNKYLWLFGDTIMGQNINAGNNLLQRYSYVTDAKSKYYFHSSVGIANKVNGVWQHIIKHYGHDSKGFPTGIINSDTKSSLLWTVNGIMLKHKLLIVTQEVPVKSLTVGTTYVLVDNPLADTSTWKYHLYRVLSPNNPEQLYTGVLRQGHWLYFYGTRGEDLTKTATTPILARININSAENAKWTALRYWHGDNQWVASSHDAKAIQGLAPQSEESFQYRPGLGWYTLQIPVLQASTRYEVHLYHSKTLTGPWQDAGMVYNTPSIWHQTDAQSKKSLFDTYAVKLHPELFDNNNIVFTYNINISMNYPGNGLQKLSDLIVDSAYSGLYIPQFVTCHFNKSSANSFAMKCAGSSGLL